MNSRWLAGPWWGGGAGAWVKTVCLCGVERYFGSKIQQRWALPDGFLKNEPTEGVKVRESPTAMYYM